MSIIGEYLVLDGTEIKAHMCGPVPSGAIKVPDGWSGEVGHDIREYDDKWNLKPVEERVALGFVTVSWEEKIEAGRIVAKDAWERIRDGIDPPPEGMKVVDGRLEPMTPNELVGAGLIDQDEADARNAAAVKARRDYLLSSTDWVELPSNQKRFSVETNERWDAYRQALRDITLQEGFPSDTIRWPVRPDRLFVED